MSETVQGVLIRKPFGGPAFRVRCSISFEDEEMLTEQCHKKKCDVNAIIAQYDKTGLMLHVNNATARYGDFTEVNEYQESLNLVMQAQEDFMALPSAIRSRFGNDPGTFLEFATNPENMDEMVKMGLAVASTPDAPVMVSVDPDSLQKLKDVAAASADA